MDAQEAGGIASEDCRREQREEFSGRGRVVTTWQRYGFPVEISDLSHFGARIRLESAANLPPLFELWLDDTGVVQPCRIAWRRNGEIGVEFTGQPVRATTKVLVELSQQAMSYDGYSGSGIKF